MVLPAWCLTPPLASPTDLRDFPLPCWNYPTAHQQVTSQVVGCAPCISTVRLYTTTGMLQLPFSPITEEFKEKLGFTWCFGTHRMMSYVKYSLKSGLKPSGQLLSGARIRSQRREQRGHWSHPDQKSWSRKYSALMVFRWDRRGHRDMVNTELNMIEEEERVATAAGKSSNACGWTGRELRPRNCHGLPWWLWNPLHCPSFFAPPTTSFPPLLTTSSGASEEMTPARCASLQEGPCGMFSHPVEVHSRCTHVAITECSPYWLS